MHTNATLYKYKDSPYRIVGILTQVRRYLYTNFYIGKTASLYWGNQQMRRYSPCHVDIWRMTMISQERHLLSNHHSFDCLFKSLCRPTSKEPGNLWIPLQRARNAGKGSIWWCHHIKTCWQPKQLWNENYKWQKSYLILLWVMFSDSLRHIPDYDDNKYDNWQVPYT